MLNSCKKNDPSSNDSATSDKGAVINGVRWATCNVDKPGAFVTHPEDIGMFYQWDVKIGWSATDPMENTIGGTAWSINYSTNVQWEIANDPCPSGWRVPTSAEIQTLLDVNKVNGTQTTVNGVGGMKFTDIASGNSIFLPAVGCRIYNGSLSIDADGHYWSSTQSSSSSNASSLYLYSGGAILSSTYRSAGLSIRPVAE